MQGTDLQNHSFQQSEHTFSNRSYKSNHIKANQKAQCPFCDVKPIILKQLQTLRAAVIAKNQKIRQLEAFIHKISKMAFTSSTDGSDNLFPVEKSPSLHLPIQELTFAQGSVSPQNQSEINSFAQEQSMQQSSRPSLGSSQISLNERQQIKDSIKRQVKRLNIDKREKQLSKQATIDYPKQSVLRTKLLSIMNNLPDDQNDSKLQSFQTESEPMGEGVIGLVNSKVSNHKIVKHAGFIKKSEVLLDQSLNSTHRSNKLKQTGERES